MSAPGPRFLSAPTAKIVLLGESAVGKSSIALRFARDEFRANQETTIGAAFLSRTVSVPTSTRPRQGESSRASTTTGTDFTDPTRSLKYEIWDTAGQERYRSLAPIYYRGACGAIVAYDITNKESLKKAQTWIKELRANASPSLVIFLVGNKKDLESMRQVSYEEGRALAAEEEVAGFYETSAKDNSNIEQVFSELALRLLDSGLTSNADDQNIAVGGIRNRAQRLGEPGPGETTPANSTCC